jgi:hypothetical protein
VTGTRIWAVDVPRSSNPHKSAELDLVNVSVWVAVASSRLISGVISGMAATKRVVMFSRLNLVTVGERLGFGWFVRDQAMMAAMAALPVMMIGVR